MPPSRSRLEAHLVLHRCVAVRAVGMTRVEADQVEEGRCDVDQRDLFAEAQSRQDGAGRIEDQRNPDGFVVNVPAVSEVLVFAKGFAVT